MYRLGQILQRQGVKIPQSTLGEWVKIAKVLPKSPIGRAIAYTLKRKENLERFLLDGRLEIGYIAFSAYKVFSEGIKKNPNLLTRSKLGLMREALF